MPGRTLASRWSLRTCRILNSLKAGRKVSRSEFRRSTFKTRRRGGRVYLSKLASCNPKLIPWRGSPALRTAFLESLPRQGSDRVQARSHSSFIASGVFPGTPHSRYQGLPVEASVIRFAHPCGAALSGVPSLRSVAARFQRFTSPWVKSRPGGRFSLLNEGSGSTPWSTAAFVQQAELPTNPR